MNYIKTNYFLLLLFSVVIINAQEKLVTKKEAISYVVNNNIALKIADKKYKISKTEYTQSKAVYLPNIKVSYTGITTTSPLMVFGSKLNQEVVTMSDFNPTLLNDPGNYENFNAKLEILQPLVNLDGIYQRKAAKIKLEAVGLEKERTTAYLIFQVEKVYMQLQLAYQSVMVVKKALETAKINQQHAQNSFDQGYLQKADLLMVQVRVNEVENQLASANSFVKNTSDYLNTLMNSDDDTLVKPADKLEANLNFKLDNEITKDRADYRAMGIAIKAYDQMYKATKMEFMPRLNAFANFERNDNKLLEIDANNYLIGVQLSWDVFKGAQRFSKLKRSKIQADKSRLELKQHIAKNETDYKVAKRMFLDAQNKLDLSKLAMKHAKESLRIRNNRFKQGLEKVSDVLMSETLYAKKQLEYYQTIFELNYAQAYLNFLSK